MPGMRIRQVRLGAKDTAETFKQYASVDAFYEDRGGLFSGESDYGVWNCDDSGLFSGRVDTDIEAEATELDGEEVFVVRASRNSRMRVSVVDDTGDVYAVQHGIGEGRVVLLGNLVVKSPLVRQRAGISDIGPTYELAERVFKGWAMSEDGSFGRGTSWFIERLKRIEAR